MTSGVRRCTLEIVKRMDMLKRAGVALCVVCAGAAGADAPDSRAADASRDAAGPAREEKTMIKEHKSGVWSAGLSDDERMTLFLIAEDTLAWCVRDGGKGAFALDGYAITPRMKEPMATFVTLKIGGQLRGCIGTLTPEGALYRSVHDNAINAALRDFRFRPVTASELPRIEVDISVLSPMVPIGSIDEFRVGEHGIVIEKGRKRAVYLPEVAVEQGWNREETLDSLSMKAGLPADAWREGARFKVFSSVVLSK